MFDRLCFTVVVLMASIGHGETSVTQHADGDAVHQYTLRGDVDRLAALLRDGGDVNATTPYAVTPLSIACRNGDLASANLLIAAGADVNQPIAGRVTSLMLAARAGNADLVSALIDAGADVDALQQDRQSALMFAASEGHADVIRCLVKAGAAINHVVPAGFTSFLLAARNGHRDVVLCLLELGVDVQQKIDTVQTGGRRPRPRMTALMLAVESAHFDLAMDLIDHGADPNDQFSGFAPLHALSWVRRAQMGDNPAGDPEPSVAGSMTSLQFARALVAAGANVNLQLKRGRGGKAKLNTKGATPLLMACHTLDVSYAELLIDLGADATRVNADQTTPLLAAAGIGVVNPTDGYPGTMDEAETLIRSLVVGGSDINHRDANGETAMHGAAYRNSPQLVRVVASLRADPQIWNRPNRYGWTPLAIARGSRPGSFKPDPPTIEMIQALMPESKEIDDPADRATSNAVSDAAYGS
ncbi:MAG: ankyrin repeat domain-containing protein [Planctomycetota bacterium]